VSLHGALPILSWCIGCARSPDATEAPAVGVGRGLRAVRVSGGWTGGSRRRSTRPPPPARLLAGCVVGAASGPVGSLLGDEEGAVALVGDGHAGDVVQLAVEGEIGRAHV